MKFSPGDLNLIPYLSHPTDTYTCRITITSKMCEGPFPPLVLLSPHTLRVHLFGVK